MKKVLITFFFSCILFQSGICQKYELGVKAGLYDYYYFGNGIVGNWFLESNTSVVLGKSLGLYFRINHNHLYFESQIAFSYNISTLYLTNLIPERDYGGEQVFSTIAGINQMHFGIPLKGGLQIAYKNFNFRGFMGISPTILVKTQSSDIYINPWEEIDKCIFNSYEPTLINGNYGVEIDYWRFSLEIKRENNLTPIIKSVNYEGEDYAYRLDTRRLFIIIGFNFYPWKPKQPGP
jgi:hypothetical protein